jgi:hypothetical protein
VQRLEDFGQKQQKEKGKNRIKPFDVAGFAGSGSANPNSFSFQFK